MILCRNSFRVLPLRTGENITALIIIVSSTQHGIYGDAGYLGKSDCVHLESTPCVVGEIHYILRECYARSKKLFMLVCKTSACAQVSHSIMTEERRIDLLKL